MILTLKSRLFCNSVVAGRWFRRCTDCGACASLGSEPTYWKGRLGRWTLSGMNSRRTACRSSRAIGWVCALQRWLTYRSLDLQEQARVPHSCFTRHVISFRIVIVVVFVIFSCFVYILCVFTCKDALRNKQYNIITRYMYVVKIIL